MNSYKYILFDLGGKLENSVYPGIETLLAGLKSAGKTLIVATSKGVHGTEVVLNHFGLKKL